MKKFLYVAVMALTFGMFTSCMPNVSVREEPEIDETNATINGKHYDNEVYKCWEFKYEATCKATGVETEHESGVENFWMTEFQINCIKANFDYESNYSVTAYGVTSSCKGSSSIRELDKDESDCYAED